MKSSKARALLHECGDMLPIPGHISNNLKTSVMKYVYGSSKVLICCRDTGNTMGKIEKEENTKINAR